MIRRGFSQVGPSAPNRGAAGFVHCAFQAFRVYTKNQGPKQAQKHEDPRFGAEGSFLWGDPSKSQLG